MSVQIPIKELENIKGICLYFDKNKDLLINCI